MATPNIVPRADSEGGIGTSSKYWASAYIDNVYVSKIGRDADNLLDFSADNRIDFYINGGGELRLENSHLSPLSNDGLRLGSSGLGFSDFFLASGAVINFDSGNFTLTHSTDALAIADGMQIRIGSGNDLRLYHQTNSYVSNEGSGNLEIRNLVDDADVILSCDDGSGGSTAYLTLDGSVAKTAVSRPLLFGDNISAEYGAGTDMIMYHSGSNGFIENYNGNFTIIQHTNDADIIFKCDDGSGGTTAYLTLDGSTTSMQAAKNIVFADSISLVLGAGNDFLAYHNGTHTYLLNDTGNLELQSRANDADLIFKCDDGAGGVANYFYLDGSSATHDGSATTMLTTNWPDNSHITLGTSHDFHMYHTGTQTVISQQGTGNLTIQNTVDDADISFSCDDGAGSTTEYFRLDGGLASSGNYVFTLFPDNSRVTYGNGLDLQIWHDSTDSQIYNGTGDLKIEQAADDKDIILYCDDGSGGSTPYITLDGSSGYTVANKDINFLDSISAKFGTGNDLTIQHNGSNSYMTANGAGDLYIKQMTADQHIFLQNDDGSGGEVSYLQLDGANVRTTFLKPGRFLDSIELQIGLSADLKLYHNATDSVIENENGNLYIVNDADDKDIIFQCDDGSGALETYFLLDGSESVVTFLDDKRLTFGTDRDLFLYHTGSEAQMKNYTGQLTFSQEVNDGDIVFKSDDGSGGTTAYITLDGSETRIDISKFMRFADGVEARFGAQSDLQVHHDGSNSYISQNGTGDLYIKQMTADQDLIFQCDDGAGGDATYFFLDGSAAVHDGSATTHLFTTWVDNCRIAVGTGRDFQITHNGTDTYQSNNTGDLIIQNNTVDKDIVLKSDDGSGSTTTYLQLDGSDVSTKILTQKVIMSNLPTSDPSNAGQLWNDSGTLKISAG